jgi:hypothetical protein
MTILFYMALGVVALGPWLVALWLARDSLRTIDRLLDRDRQSRGGA